MFDYKKDVIKLASDLVNCKSVTPADDGAVDRIADYLSSIGFETKILYFKSADATNVVKNLFARYGHPSGSKSSAGYRCLGFLGHSDVVPPGNGWDVDPFAAVQENGYLIGRGISDMKGGIAAFCCAAAEFIKYISKEEQFNGSIKIFITGDEEIGSYEGARSLIEWGRKTENLPDDCLIGEPSSKIYVGDRVYTGHRGSLNITAKSIGQQGHVAYQGSYENSLANICKYIASMMSYNWKYQDKRFPKTNLEPTMLFTNNYAENVVPDLTSARLNIRYGADYNSDDLKEICLKEAKKYGVSLDFSANGDSYYCDNQNLKNILSDAINEVTGRIPQFSAGGGISDGRYMITHCNIIEFGLQDSCIHQKNEKAKIEDLLTLQEIYLSFIKRYFKYV